MANIYAVFLCRDSSPSSFFSMQPASVRRVPEPFSNLVVVDMTHVLNGAFGTTIPADLGARLLKIERPGRGDETRDQGLDRSARIQAPGAYQLRHRPGWHRAASLRASIRSRLSCTSLWAAIINGRDGVGPRATSAYPGAGGLVHGAGRRVEGMMITAGSARLYRKPHLRRDRRRGASLPAPRPRRRAWGFRPPAISGDGYLRVTSLVGR